MSIRTNERKRGALASPRHKLAGARPHRIAGDTPPQFAVIPPQLSMWGNDQYGDCVSAEEAFAKAAYSLMAGQSELFINEREVIAWAAARGFLNGAKLTDVMDAMIAKGMAAAGVSYQDGRYASVDWTDHAVLSNAIAQGPVKIGVAAGQLENCVGNANGWILCGARRDQNIDHSVSLCGFGPLSYLAGLCGVSLPAGVDGAKPGYLLFTWETVGIIDQPSLVAICGEAWLRSPTTAGQTPPVPPTPPAPPVPPPVPPEPPRPWWWPCRKAVVYAARSVLLADARLREIEAMQDRGLGI